MVQTKVSSNSDKKVLDGTSDEGYIADSEGRDWVYSATQGTVSDATWVFNWKQMRARWHPDYLFGARHNYTVHRHWDEDYMNSDYIIAVDADREIASYGYPYPVYNQSVTLTEKSDSLRRRRRCICPWFCIILIFILGILITVPIIVAMILSSSKPASPSDILGRVRNELILAKFTYTEEMRNASSAAFKELATDFEKEMRILYLSNITRSQYAGSKISRVVFLGNDSMKVDYDLFFRVKNMRIPTHKTLRTILYSVERDKVDRNLGVLGDLRFRIDSHKITESKVVKRNDMNTTFSKTAIIVEFNKNQETSTKTTNLLIEKENKSNQDSAVVITNKIIIKTEHPGTLDVNKFKKDDPESKIDNSNNEQITEHPYRSVEKTTNFQAELSPMAPIMMETMDGIFDIRTHTSSNEIVTRSFSENNSMQNGRTEDDTNINAYFTNVTTNIEEPHISTTTNSCNHLSTTLNPKMIDTAQTVYLPTTYQTSAIKQLFETTNPIPAKGHTAKKMFFNILNKITLKPTPTEHSKRFISKPNSTTEKPNSKITQPTTEPQFQTTTVSHFDFDTKQLKTSPRTTTNYNKLTDRFQHKSEIQSTTAYSEIRTDTQRFSASSDLTTKMKGKSLQVSLAASEARSQLLLTLPSLVRTQTLVNTKVTPKANHAKAIIRTTTVGKHHVTSSLSTIGTESQYVAGSKNASETIGQTQTQQVMITPHAINKRYKTTHVASLDTSRESSTIAQATNKPHRPSTNLTFNNEHSTKKTSNLINYMQDKAKEDEQPLMTSTSTLRIPLQSTSETQQIKSSSAQSTQQQTNQQQIIPMQDTNEINHNTTIQQKDVIHQPLHTFLDQVTESIQPKTTNTQSLQTTVQTPLPPTRSSEFNTEYQGILKHIIEGSSDTDLSAKVTPKTTSEIQKSTIVSGPMSESHQPFSITYSTRLKSMLQTQMKILTPYPTTIKESFTDSMNHSKNTKSSTESQLQIKRTSHQLHQNNQTLTAPTQQTTDLRTTTNIQSKTTEQQPIAVSRKPTVETEQQTVPKKLTSETLQTATTTSQSTTGTKQQQETTAWLYSFQTEAQPKRVSQPFTRTDKSNDARFITFMTDAAERRTSTSPSITEKERQPISITTMAKTQGSESKIQQTTFSKRSKTTAYDSKIDTERRTTTFLLPQNSLRKAIVSMNQTQGSSNTKEPLIATHQTKLSQPEIDTEQENMDSQLLAKPHQRSTTVQLNIGSNFQTIPNLQSTTETQETTRNSAHLVPRHRQVTSDAKQLLTETIPPVVITTRSTETVSHTANSLNVTRTQKSPLTARDFKTDTLQQTRKTHITTENLQPTTTTIPSMTVRLHKLTSISKPTIKMHLSPQPSQPITQTQQPKSIVTTKSFIASEPTAFKTNRFRIISLGSTTTETPLPTKPIPTESMPTSTEKVPVQQMQTTHSQSIKLSKMQTTTVNSLPRMISPNFFTATISVMSSDKAPTRKSVRYITQSIEPTTVTSLPSVTEPTAFTFTASETSVMETPITEPQFIAEPQEPTTVVSFFTKKTALPVSKFTTSGPSIDKTPVAKISQFVTEPQEQTTVISIPTITSPTVFTLTTPGASSYGASTTKSSKFITESQEPTAFSTTLPFMSTESVTTSRMTVDNRPRSTISNFVTESHGSTSTAASQPTMTNPNLYNSIASLSTSDRQSITTSLKFRTESQELRTTTTLLPMMTTTTVSNMTTRDEQPITTNSQFIDEPKWVGSSSSGPLPVTSEETLKTSDQPVATNLQLITDYQEKTTYTSSQSFTTPATTTTLSTPTILSLTTLKSDSDQSNSTPNSYIESLNAIASTTSRLTTSNPYGTTSTSSLLSSDRQAFYTNPQFISKTQEKTTDSLLKLTNPNTTISVMNAEKQSLFLTNILEPITSTSLLPTSINDSGNTPIGSQITAETRPITLMPRFKPVPQEPITPTQLTTADIINTSTSSQTNVDHQSFTSILQSITESQIPSTKRKTLLTEAENAQTQDTSTVPIILSTMKQEGINSSTTESLPLSTIFELETKSEEPKNTFPITTEEILSTSLPSWTNMTLRPKAIITQFISESQNSTASKFQTGTSEMDKSTTVVEKQLFTTNSPVIKELQEQNSTIPTMFAEFVRNLTASWTSANKKPTTLVSSSVDDSQQSARPDASLPTMTTPVYTLTGFLEATNNQPQTTASQYLSESQEQTTTVISPRTVTSLPINVYTSTASLTDSPQLPTTTLGFIPESKLLIRTATLLSVLTTPTANTSSYITADRQTPTTTSKPSISTPFVFDTSLPQSNSVETSTDFFPSTFFEPLSETISSLSTTAVQPTTTISPQMITKSSTSSIGLPLVPPFSDGIGILFPPDTIPIVSDSKTLSIAPGTQSKEALSPTSASDDNVRNQLFPFQPNFGGSLINLFPSMERPTGSISNEISIIRQNNISRKAETTTAFNPSFEYLWSLGDSVLDTLLSREKMFRTPDREWDKEHLSGLNSSELQKVMNDNGGQFIAINQTDIKSKETDVITDGDENGINLGVPITVDPRFDGTTNRIISKPVTSIPLQDNTVPSLNTAIGIPLSVDNKEVLALLENLPPLVRQTTTKTFLKDDMTKSIGDNRITKSVIPTLLDLQLDPISPTTLQTTKETTFAIPSAAEKPSQNVPFTENTFDMRSNNLLGFGSLGNMFGGGMFGILGNSDFLLREPIRRTKNDNNKTTSVNIVDTFIANNLQNLEKGISKNESSDKNAPLDKNISAAPDINSISSEINRFSLIQNISPTKNDQNSSVIFTNRRETNSSKLNPFFSSSEATSRHNNSGRSDNNRVLNELQPIRKLTETQSSGNNMVIESSNLLNNGNFGFFGNFLNMDTNDILQPSLTIPDTSLISASDRGTLRNELQPGAIDFILPASNDSLSVVPVLSEFSSDFRNGMNLVPDSNLQDVSGSFDISNVPFGKDAITIPPNPTIDANTSLEQGPFSFNSTSIHDTSENDTKNLIFTRERPGLFSISSSDLMSNITGNESGIVSSVDSQTGKSTITQISETERTVNNDRNTTLVSTEDITSSILTANLSFVINGTNQTNTVASFRGDISTTNDNLTSTPELIFELTQKAYISYPVALVWRLFSIEGWKFVIVQKEIPDASPVIIGVVTEQSMIAAPGFSTLSISTDSVFTSSQALIYVDIPSVVCEDEGMYTVRVLGTSNIVLAERSDFLPIFDVPIVQTFVADNMFEGSNFQDPHCVARVGYPQGRLFLQVRYPGDESYGSFMSTPDVENVTLTSTCRKVVRVSFGEYLNKTRDLNNTEVRCGVVDTPAILNQDGIIFSNTETINIIPDTVCNNSSAFTTHPFRPCNYIDCAKGEVIDCPQDTCFNSTSNICDSVNL